MDGEIICHETGKDPMFRIWHASEQAMFIYMHSDGGSIVCGEKAYPINKGVLCFVGAGKYHYTVPEVPEKYDRSKLFVAGDELGKILELVAAKDKLGAFVYALVDESERDKVESVFQKIKEYEHNEAYGKWIMISGIMELLVFLNRYAVENVPATLGTVSRAVEYINVNIGRNITIDEICTVLHMSKYHFCRQFKKHTGFGFQEYLTQLRLQTAANLLMETDLSVNEIAGQCGFSGGNYFGDAFKRAYNLSPMQYRKAMHESE